MRIALRTRLRAMAAADIPQVADIERESFPSMWPQTAYRSELQNKLAPYLVIVEQHAEAEDPAGANARVRGALRRIVGTGAPAAASTEYLLGFIGVWLMAGEAHIVTFAVREAYRRMGIGERLLSACIEMAIDAEQEAVTLEVRRSNTNAQVLYEKYGFSRLGLRRRYYTDNNEDAVVMTTPDVITPAYRERFGRLRDEHRMRHPDLWS